MFLVCVDYFGFIDDRGCSTAVKHLPHNQEVVGAAEFLTFFLFYLSIKQVQCSTTNFS